MKIPKIATIFALAITALLMCFHNAEASTGIAKYIIGGHEAVKNQFPWLVQILRAKTPTDTPIMKCAGTIIGTRWILTTARCLYSDGEDTPTLVFFGSLLKDGSDAEYKEDTFRAFIQHEKYDPEEETDSPLFMNPYDIGLIKLTTPLYYTAGIKALPPPRLGQHVPDDATITIAGWGYLSPGDKVAGIPRLEDTTLMFMKTQLRKSVLSEGFLTLCTKVDSFRGATIGDTGGAMIWRDDMGIDRIVGVIKGSGMTFNYKRYTCGVSIMSFRQWIKDVTDT